MGWADGVGGWVRGWVCGWMDVRRVWMDGCAEGVDSAAGGSVAG